MKAIWDRQDELIKGLGKSTATIKHSHLTARMFSARLTRKTLAFSKQIEFHEAAVIWEDACYNWVRPHKSLRVQVLDDPQRKWTHRTPAMAASLTDHKVGKVLLTSLDLTAPVTLGRKSKIWTKE